MTDKIHTTVNPTHPVTHDAFQIQKRGDISEERTQRDDYFRDTLDSEQTPISEEKATKTISRSLEEQLEQRIAQWDNELSKGDDASSDKAIWLAREIIVLLLAKESKSNHDDLEKIARRVEIAVQKICKLHTDRTTIALKYLGAAIHIVAGVCGMTPLISGVASISQSTVDAMTKLAAAGTPLAQAVGGFEGIANASVEAAKAGTDHERAVANELKSLSNERNSSNRSTREQQSRRIDDARGEEHNTKIKVLTATQV